MPTTSKKESDKKGCIYGTLCDNEYYLEFVKEYWNTLDECTVLCPRFKSLMGKINKSTADVRSITDYDAALDLVLTSASKIRPTQTDGLVKALTSKVELLCQAIVTGSIDVDAHVCKLDAFLLNISGIQSESMPSLSAARDAVTTSKDAAAQQDETTKFDKSLDELGNKLSNVDPNDSVMDLDVGDFKASFASVAGHVTFANSSDIGGKLVAVIESGLAVLMRKCEPKAFALPHSFGPLMLVVEGLTRTSTYLEKPLEVQAIQSIAQFAKQFDSIAAIITVHKLGPDSHSRYSADPKLERARAASASLQNVRTLTDGFGDDAPGWLKVLYAYSQECLNSFGEHARTLRCAQVKCHHDVLQKVSTIPPFCETAVSHWLDESEYATNDDIDELISFLQSTLFTVSPDALESALHNAEATKTLTTTCREIFNLEISQEERKLDECLIIAKTTKCENVLLAILVEHRSKPIKLKRAVRDHLATFKDVWAMVHPVVANAASNFGASIAKEPKVD